MSATYDSHLIRGEQLQQLVERLDEELLLSLLEDLIEGRYNRLVDYGYLTQDRLFYLDEQAMKFLTNIPSSVRAKVEPFIIQKFKNAVKYGKQKEITLLMNMVNANAYTGMAEHFYKVLKEQLVKDKLTEAHLILGILNLCQVDDKKLKKYSEKIKNEINFKDRVHLNFYWIYCEIERSPIDSLNIFIELVNSSSIDDIRELDVLYRWTLVRILKNIKAKNKESIIPWDAINKIEYDWFKSIFKNVLGKELPYNVEYDSDIARLKAFLDNKGIHATPQKYTYSFASTALESKVKLQNSMKMTKSKKQINKRLNESSTNSETDKPAGIPNRVDERELLILAITFTNGIKKVTINRRYLEHFNN